MGSKKIKRKLERTWMKMLRAYSKRLLDRGFYLEDKAIRLELKLRDELEREKHAEP